MTPVFSRAGNTSLSPPTTCTPPCTPGMSPHSSPASKIKYSICIAGKSSKSLLSLSCCSRNISGVISMGARPSALHSFLAWTTLPFPHVSLSDASGGGADSANSRATHSTHSVGAAGFRGEGVHGPQIVMKELLAQMIRWSHQSIPHRVLTHQPCPPPSPCSIPALRALCRIMYLNI